MPTIRWKMVLPTFLVWCLAFVTVVSVSINTTVVNPIVLNQQANLFGMCLFSAALVVASAIVLFE
jgi:hypothetical protein